MITKIGDIFSQDLSGQVIAHGCNRQGVMGAGVAKIIKDLYPLAFQDYIDNYNKLPLGSVIASKYDDPIIANCLTQKDYGNWKHIRYVSYDAVDSCFKNLASNYRGHKIVNFPLIGGGLANGNKDVLISIYKHHFPGDGGVLWLLGE